MQLDLPDTSSLCRMLASHMGKNAYLVPMTSRSNKTLGNNGDRLMLAVFRKVLREILFITETNSAEDADIVIVPPNGAMLETYSFPGILAERLKGHEDKPLVIFPSSAMFPTKDPSVIFAGRSASTDWVLRERPSLEHLRARWSRSLDEAGVSLHLDHDIVASGHRFVPEILGPQEGRSALLIAARHDVEASAATMRGSSSRAASASWLGELERVKQQLPSNGPLTWVARNLRSTAIWNTAESLVAGLPAPDLAELAGFLNQAERIDLSDPHYATFNRYRSVLTRSERVVTNRLHVALPAAIVGKEVYLVEAGYHKLSGVYQQSLRGLTNVHLSSDSAA